MTRTHCGGTRRFRRARTGLAWAVLLVAVGCDSDDSAGMFGGSASNDSSDESYRGGAANNAAPNVGLGAAEGGASGAAEPAEQEVTVELEAPQSSVNYVYATNPERDSVAVIDAASLAIHVVDTGDQPRFLRTIPGRDAALLVDVGANDVAYIETVQGKSTVSYFRDLPSANVIRVAPDGKHAVAYFDVTRMQQGNFETLQDVSVLTFDEGGPRAVRMTVGFKARQVTFAGGASGASAAYVVTEDGVSILDFAKIDATKKAAIADTVPIFSASEAQGADVSVTPDGKFAIGRIEDTSTLRMVELETGKAHSLDLSKIALSLPQQTQGMGGAGGASGLGGTSGSSGQAVMLAGAAGNAGSVGQGAGGTTTATTASSSTKSTSVPVATELTDLDVSPDGKFALAVSRSTGVLVRIPIPEGFYDASSVTQQRINDVTVGAAAISGNGRWAVLYTTVITSERRIVIVDLTGAVQPRVLDLTKSIKGIAFSSSGEQAYVVHAKGAGDRTATGITPEEVLERSNAYTLIDLNKAFRKLVITESEANFSVTTPNAPYVFLSFQDAGASSRYTTLVQRLDMDSLQVSDIQLGSIPVSMGVVPAAGRVFVNQKYGDGRLTFIDWTTLETTTVTGYELNSKIRE